MVKNCQADHLTLIRDKNLKTLVIKFCLTEEVYSLRYNLIYKWLKMIKIYLTIAKILLKREIRMILKNERCCRLELPVFKSRTIIVNIV